MQRLKMTYSKVKQQQDYHFMSRLCENNAV